MRRIPLLLLSVLTCAEVHAQGWGANVNLGVSYGRLLPSEGSTRQTKNIRYSFGGPGISIGSEIFLILNEYNRVLFSYQLSENKTGIKFRAGMGAGSNDFNYELFQLHNYSVGFCHFRSISHDKIMVGMLVKMGIANGLFAGSGYGTSGNGGTAGYVQTQPATNGNVMSTFWIPNATIGLTLSPRFQWSPLMERLMISGSLTAGFKDIYTDFAKVNYSIYTDKGIDKGIAQYKGSPLLLQLSVSYGLFMRHRED